RASCSRSSRTTSARAAVCQAANGFSAGWFCVSRAIASPAMTTPLTVMPAGAGSALALRASITVTMASLRRHGPDVRGGTAGRDDRGGGARAAGAGHSGLAPRAHDLVAAAPEIPDRRAPHVDQPREREHEEDRHPDEQVQLEYRVRIGDEIG